MHCVKCNKCNGWTKELLRDEFLVYTTGNEDTTNTIDGAMQVLPTLAMHEPYSILSQ